MIRLATAGLIAAIVCTPAWPQERKPVVPFEGSQALRHILQLLRLEPIRSLDELTETNPADTLVIFLGELDVLDELADRRWHLASYFKAGGSALIASDHGDEGKLDDLGVRIAGPIVRVPPGKGYKNQPECPLISTAEFIDPAHPIFKNVKTIATNRPSYLAAGPAALVRFPEGATSAGRVAFNTRLMVASPKSTSARARAIVIANQAIFINGMMAQHDVDNFSFAFGCLSWLAEKEGGRRKYVLLVENGKVLSDFDVPLAELPPIPIPPTRVINAVLRGIEEENLFNSVLHDNVEPEIILQGVMIFLSTILIVVVARSLFKARYRLDTGAPLIAPSLAQAISDVPVLAQRHRALLLQGNLFEAAQMLGELWFDKHVPEQERLPPYEIAGAFWQRWKLDRELRKLWEVAHGQAHEISRAEFQKLMNSVERLTVAYDRGVLRFA